MATGVAGSNSGVHVGSAMVARFPSLAASRMAVIGRQVFQWYLLFQQPIAASAAARFSLAKSRALSTMFRCREAARVRNTRFQRAKAWSCQKIAASVWSGVGSCCAARRRLDLVEVSRVGAAGQRRSARRCGASRRRGPGTVVRFRPTGAGSGAKSGGVGRQTPGVVPTAGVNGPKRPSFTRAASIAAAADSPMATPGAFAPGGVSWMAASDVS